MAGRAVAVGFALACAFVVDGDPAPSVNPAVVPIASPHPLPSRLSPPVGAAPLSEPATPRKPTRSEGFDSQLRGLPADVRRDIMRFRRELGPLVPDGQRPSVRLPATQPPPTGDGSADGAALRLLDASIRAVGQARDLVSANIAAASSVGYKRLRPVLCQSRAGGQGLTVRVDCAPGRLISSGRPLDLAIADDAFFAVRSGGELLFTRRGEFELNLRGRFVLIGHPDVELVGPECPPGTASATADSAGYVAARLHRTTILQSGTRSQVHVGRIALARFDNRQRLKPRGRGLLAATPAAGEPQYGYAGDKASVFAVLFGIEGFAPLRVGCLEAANVDVERELVVLKSLSAQLSALREARRTILKGGGSQPGRTFELLPAARPGE